MKSLRRTGTGKSPLLTRREKELIRLIAHGLGEREIAQKLAVTEASVKKSVGNILKTLGVSNRLELILLFYSRSRSNSPRHKK